MRFSKKLFMVLVSISFVASTFACGPPPVTRAEFGLKLWTNLCNTIHVACCKDKTLDEGAKKFYGADVKSCEANFSKDLDFGAVKINFKKIYDKLATSEDLEYNQAQATLCLKSTTTDSCSSGLLNPASLSGACENIFIGKKADGEKCPEGFECKPGLACVDNNGDKTCKTPAKVGESCDGGVPCENPSEVRCDFTSKKCTALKGAGEACQVGECKSDLDCTGGKCVAQAPKSPTDGLCK